MTSTGSIQWGMTMTVNSNSYAFTFDQITSVINVVLVQSSSFSPPANYAVVVPVAITSLTQISNLWLNFYWLN